MQPAARGTIKRQPISIDQYLRDNEDTKSELKAVLALDCGEVCPVASFAMPILPSGGPRRGLQLCVRRQEAYGLTDPNARWLEDKKDREKINDIEAHISRQVTGAGNPHAYMAKLRSYQSNSNKDILRNFYSRPSVLRKKWEIQRSIRSRLDSICDLLLESVKQASNNEETKVLVGVGMDGQSAGPARKGARAPMDEKFLEALKRKAKSHDFPLVRLNEYCTSQICPHCLQLGKEVFTEYLKRMPSNPSPEAEPYDVLRVKTCRVCHKYFHRDGMAAQNMALMMETLLVAGEKPMCFIPPLSRKDQESTSGSSRKKKGKRKAPSEQADGELKRSRLV